MYSVPCRQLDIREPHSCHGDGSCRNVLIDLKPTCGVSTGNTQCKCLDLNPVRHEQIAVGALDAFVRLYDTRVLSLKRTCREISSQGDPSCLAHFAPGHISNPHIRKSRKTFNTLATTYVTFSPNGRELLVNLSGEHAYLYDTVNFAEALKYDFDKGDFSSVPKIQSRSNSCIRPQSMSTDPHLLSPNPFYSSHSLAFPCTSVEDSAVSERVQRLKERGNEMYKVGNLVAAVDLYSRAIVQCPTWHILYSNRATALYARKW